ncbi:Holliday junction branch migration protein RuvA [Ancrocorticia populi]|uniref:Holliday junction branch migration complex subunit RuvA n=1 Tax=Ancrocorticia populi TaxID=2175228 RepID=A0A2V1K4M2_9ACTO|nr:Holliday junction branch migration protein RuvA [Ancrocorticia populi]MDN6487088.1 Holliday junction branch migration protein RuvA [Ancrocorticia sp.]PWF24589.1 Holliday junction branch migration protein RuvA [Ancrocorticia populi]
MIASVHGTVAHVGIAQAVIEVGGVGLAVLATPTTLSGLREGAPARLATSLVVREDSLTLFGFSDDDERDTFNILQGVSGVGPKVALNVLSVHTPDALRTAVANKDSAALQRVSGIGKKGAERLLLELGNKLGPATGVGARPAAPANALESDVVEALVGLGWPERDAHAAYESAAATETDGSVAGLLRSSLQILGAR